ncbi:ABC transporter permease (plasmid) [Devosia sp. A8/3-2]|nr:ABC transporter permease [Devosia sp. A8/3-2]
MVAGDKATEAQLIQIRSNLGLDRPIHEQYLSFIAKAVQGDTGFSYRNQQPVISLIANRLPATLSLVAGGVILWLAVGIPIGIMSARHPGGFRDRLGRGFILIGLSFPTFVLGMMSLYIFYFLPRQSGFTLFPPAASNPSCPTRRSGLGTWHCLRRRWR